MTSDSQPSPASSVGIKAVLRHWPFAIVALIALVGYQVVQGRYYLHYMDDAWVMSWVWHYMRHGTEVDPVFRDGEYLLLFGKGMWLLYGGLLQVFGWSKAHALEISTALVYGAGVCWYFIGRRMGWDVQTSLILAFGIVLLDKVVEAGVLCRSEALILCCMSVALLAFMHGRYLLAGALAIASAEAHPIALTAVFYMLAWTLHERRYFLDDKRRTLRQLAWFSGGVLLGVLWYVWLHKDALTAETFLNTLRDSNKFGGGERTDLTYLDRHFRWHSRPELMFYTLALLIYLQKKLWRENLFPIAAVACVVLSALLNRRPNGFYAALAIPAFATLAVCAYRRAGILRPVFLVLILSFVFECHGRWSKLADFQPQASITRLQEVVPDDGLPVVGMNDFWFVFKERPFMPGDFDGDIAARLKSPEWADLYLLDSSFKSRRYTFGRIKQHLRRHFRGREVARFKEHDKHVLKVIRYTRR